MKGVFKHIKSGHLYKVLYDDAIIEKTMTPAVVYQRIEELAKGLKLTTGPWWIRPKDEFFDGRFVHIPEDDVTNDR